MRRDFAATVAAFAIGAMAVGGYSSPSEPSSLARPQAGAESLPVPAAWLSQIEKSILESEYEVSWQTRAKEAGVSGAYQAPNRAHGFRTWFGPSGITVVPREDQIATWEWELELVDWGRPAAVVPIEGASQEVEKNVLRYHRPDVTEWYENSERGLKQGFVVHRPPAVSREEIGGESDLVIDLRLTGTLHPRFSEDGQAIDFDRNGCITVLRYSELRVTDARGEPLAARFQGVPGAIRISIDDSDAVYPITVDPLATSPAWTVTGENVFAYLGNSVATAGDVNGDGYSDVLVGSWAYGFATGLGRAYLYLGSSAGLATSAAWIGTGSENGSQYGVSVATAGDVNGDGYSDVIVGANLHNAGVSSTADRGRAYLYLGSSTGLSASPAWTGTGDENLAFYGSTVATAGDVNGDGYSDVLVGAYGHDAGAGDGADRGRAYLYLGSSTGLATSAAWTGSGNENQVYFSYNGGLTTAGDVNGDSYSDVIVGAYAHDAGAGVDRGQAYLFLGSSTGLAATAAWTESGNENVAYFGLTLAPAGDANGDGYSDVVVGAGSHDAGFAGSNRGQAYLYLGSATGLSTIAAWVGSGDESGAGFGGVSTAGDVNGDGYSDVVIAAGGHDAGASAGANRGRTYLYFGSAVGLATSAAWTGSGDEDTAAFSTIATAGDVNGDGYSDVIVGARLHDGGGSQGGDRGRAYLYLGSAAGLATNAGWTRSGNESSAFGGYAVGAAGDVNGDGYSDIIVGAHGHDAGAANRGQTYLYFGSAAGIATTAAWTGSGNQDGELFGYSVAAAGDVNGDGYSDVLVGSPGWNNGTADQGRASAFLGSAAGLATVAVWSAEGNQAGAKFGSALGSAGDVNGDGFLDVIVGAPWYDSTLVDEGGAWVFLGSAAGLAAAPGWSLFGGQSGAQLGTSVASAGDVDRDAYSDVIVGSPRHDAASDEGRALVFRGGASGLALSPFWDVTGAQAGARFGESVAGVGDLNGDGFSDVAVGAPGWDTSNADEGRAFVYVGSSSALSLVWQASNGGGVSALFGGAVARAGDVNGDGFGDFLVGIPGYTAGFAGEGAAKLYFGSAVGPSASATWTATGGQAGAAFGTALAGGGDVNGDSFADVVVGAPSFDVGGVDEGQSSLFYGNGESGPGLALRPEQRRFDDSAPIGWLGRSDSGNSMRLSAIARSPFGRGRVKLQWEVKPRAISFDGSNVGETGWADSGVAGAVFSELVIGLGGSETHHWRLRLRYSPVTAPFSPGTRWFTHPAGGWNEALFRTTAACLAIVPATLPNGIKSVPYSSSITASGGTPPYAYTGIFGSLPPGLVLTEGTGLVSGTPSIDGTFRFAVRASDSTSCYEDKWYDLVIECHPDLRITTTTSVPVVAAQASFSYGVVVTHLGPCTAPAVTVTDTLPVGFTASTITCSPGTCSAGGGVVTWSIGTLTTGATASMQITGAAAIPTIVTNEAVVSSSLPELDSTNNQASVSTTVVPVGAAGSVAPLNTGRSGLTATLLPSGRIVVIGGSAGGAAISTEILDPDSLTWATAANPAIARAGHSATLLPSGKILVVSLQNPPEVYDPVTNSWANTLPMTAPRQKHTSTLLPDGRVLVIGGASSGGTPLSQAEVYNPGTNGWTSAGTTAVAHSSATATLLADGRVLVAGGGTGTAGITSCEIWSAGSFSGTGALSGARLDHAAVRLGNGKVVVAGGVNGSGLTSAEIFDPAGNGGIGNWNPAAPMPVARKSPVAALLPNGRILLSGADSNVAGDSSRAATYQYDPGANGWAQTASLQVGRHAPVPIVLPRGPVMMLGGVDLSGNFVSTVELIQPAAETVTAGGTLATTREKHTATLLPSGRVLLVGGLGPGALASAELWDPMTQTTTPAGVLTTARSEHTATLLPSGKVLVCGGYGSGSTELSTCQLFEEGVGWAPTGSMSVPRARHSATLLPSNEVVVLGSTAASNQIETYDAAAGTWRNSGALVLGRWFHAATLLADGRVLVAGGKSGPGSSLSSCEIFDPLTSSSRITSSLPVSRFGLAALRFGRSGVLVVGGQGDGGTPLDAALVFDPASEQWIAGGSTPSCAHDPARATVLRSGDVLVTGGCNATSADVLDLATRTWRATKVPLARRTNATSTLLADGTVLVAGGSDPVSFGRIAANERWDEQDTAARTAPSITGGSPILSFGVPVSIVGTGFRGDSEASSSMTSASAANFPLIQLMNMATGARTHLHSAPRTNFWDDPMTLTVPNLPSSLDPGWHLLTAVSSGVPSVSRPIKLDCTVAIEIQPSNQTVALNSPATFTVQAAGARSYQWYRNDQSIPGATSATYVTPPITGGDSGSAYRCVVTGACSSVTSIAAILTAADSTPPSVNIVSPAGGEYWLLSPASGPANTRVVSWSMSDNIRICRVDASLRYSTNGGTTWTTAPAGGGLPATFGSGGSCAFPGVTTSNLTYTIPSTFPSGVVGALYKIRVIVTDQAGLPTTAESPNPFYIVESNQDSVKTLILANTARMQSVMGISAAQAADLDTKLQELGNHPRVQGFVVDLGTNSDVSALYGAWDADLGNSDKANNVLFGCESAAQSGCATVGIRSGIHDTIRQLLAAYSGTQNLVLVGDDRIIPLARLADRTALFPESNYASPGPDQDLTPAGTTVALALEANKFLSDDLVAVKDAIMSSETSGYLYIPDLAVGRLVESPAEITTTIATFISQDGVLDLGALDPATGHKVLVSGYDFLSDSSRTVRQRWKTALGVATGISSLEPVDGSLIGGNWSLPNMAQRIAELRTHWGGNGSTRYAVGSLNGHATHYEEGVPAADQGDTIQGLRSIDVYGPEPIACTPPTTSLGALALAGGVIYNVGCHGGLPVPGSCALDADHSLDLPQTMAARGIVGYVANTGYGWGLKHGIGYSERLAELATEELTAGGTVAFGEAVRQSKIRYFLESPRFDAYDEKCLMQWTYYGLPMYAVKTGIAAGAVDGAQALDKRVDTERFGPVVVEKHPDADAAATLPPYLTQLTLRFDFSAPGVYSKKKSTGEPETQALGCSDPDGCYYTLNGLVERSTGGTDLPVQPYFIYDSRLSGTSQHGALWKGGQYKEESGWIPILAELASNGGDGSNHGSTARVTRPIPLAPRLVPGIDPTNCRPSDLELNSLVLTAGEAVKNQTTDPTYTMERTYEKVDLELFYFNDTVTPANNCDRSGPLLEPGPYAGGKYHQTTAMRIDWSVPVSDTSGVWRVLVVVTGGNLDAQSKGTWTSQELTNDGTGTWTGSRSIVGTLRLTYVIEAIDNRGNVTWLEFSGTLPASGVPLGVADPVDAALADTDSDGMADSWENANGLSVGANDAALDPDADGLTNLQEFQRGTRPMTQDTDGDGDNDGSEAAHSHDPLVSGDGHDIVIIAARSGPDIVISWTGDAANSSGPYYVYRAAGPFFSAADLRATLPLPAPATSYSDAGASGGSSYYYWVTNVAIVATPAPSIAFISPNNGPQAGGNVISIYGDAFVSGSTVTIAGVACTTVVVVNSSKIDCTVPAHVGAGSFDVRVTSPNGQYGALAGGYTYNP